MRAKNKRALPVAAKASGVRPDAGGAERNKKDPPRFGSPWAGLFFFKLVVVWPGFHLRDCLARTDVLSQTKDCLHMIISWTLPSERLESLERR
jgi:hypothetical protein